MKKFLLILSGLFFLNNISHSQLSPKFIPSVSFEEADIRADVILSKMSMTEKTELISGYRTFYIKGFEKYGIPELYLSDGPQGVNIRENFSNSVDTSTAFPCPIALSSTWNPLLAKEYATAIGEECRAGGIAVLLGPGMNIYRIAQCGRNFEYMGEDPFLISRMVENYVVGMQNTGTMATIKHFACNNTDFYRRRSNSVVDERTLHEIYLPAFKAGIDAGAMAVMTSYNQLNGEWAGQSSYVINQLLRNELGFKGLVMSDWNSVWDAKKIILSGQDLEMPGNQNIKKNALTLLANKEVSQNDINRMAKSIIRTCISMGLYDRPIKDASYEAKFPGHKEVALRTAREAIVLLKNQNNILPIKGDTVNTILLTGDYVENLASGGGSAAVEGYDIVSMLNALQNEFGNKLIYAKTPTDEQIKSADVVLLSIGTFDRENFDRPFNLPEAKDKQILDMAAKNKNLVVIVNSGSGIRMTNWNDKVAAIVYSWYLGQNGNTALAEILSGKTNPSGKLPITIEKEFEDSPGYGYIPEGMELYTNMPADENLNIDNLYDINYQEGIFVGYRWYESKNITPLYPFGHGLSYTSFEYGKVTADKKNMYADDMISFTVTVKNTGNCEGAEVVQLYISDKASSLPRPMKELKGFRKILLKSGEEQVVSFTIDKKALSFYDPDKHAWVVEPGTFEALIGSSSTEINGKIAFELLPSDSQKVLFDEDFSSTEWLDAFADYLTVLRDEPTDLRTTAENTGYELGTAASIKGFTFNGTVRRYDPSFTSVCGRDFNHCFRMRHNGASFLEFPSVAKAGKISVYARNESASTASELNLQSKDELGGWNNITQWSIPGSDSYPGTDFLLTYEINNADTVMLRLQRQQARFMQIYRIVLEESALALTANSLLDKQIGLTVTDKTVHFSKMINDASFFVYDVSGRQVFKTNVNTDAISLNELKSGVYIVKLHALQGGLTQKVIIN